MKLNEKVRTFIRENLIVLEEDEAEIADSDNIFELGYVNSLFAMKLLNYVETEFNVRVMNEDMNLKNFSSVNSIVELVRKKTDNS
jgi:acyl carrier protein